MTRVAFAASRKKQMLFLSIKKWQTVSKKLSINISYISMYAFFIQNNLITPDQSGFKTGGSGFKQPIFVTLEICKSFDDDCEVRELFLDISKPFDKVWHRRFHFKLRQNGMLGKLLNFLSDRLDNSIQRVILNGYSSWAKVEVGVLEFVFEKDTHLVFGKHVSSIVFVNLLLTCYFLYLYIWS